MCDRVGKRPTGIAGLDAATHGGLPAAGAVLVVGAPGSGKTVLGLQILAAAIARGEGGVLLSFEETTAQLRRDAASFSWGQRLGESSRCELLAALGTDGAEVAGAFDIDGLLAALALCSARVAASWVVLDGIDRLLQLQPDARTAVDQVLRISRWCEAQGLTLLLTAKPADQGLGRPDHLAGVEYLLSTVLLLSARIEGQTLERRLRIVKYRGSSHVTEELAVVMNDDGLHLPYGQRPTLTLPEACAERVSTGVPGLDAVLGGGLYRGSSTLISGQPGTSKTTLAASFAAATAARGERALYLSFDELAGNIVRNVASVGIALQPHIDAGRLRLLARAAWLAPVEAHYLALCRELDTFQPRCLVIDPASALLKAPGAPDAYLAIERIVALTRQAGITTLLTSLSQQDDPLGETSLSHTSTLADTWIVLRYQVRGGERNRSLSVAKSRGTAHSNQVREMLISAQGITLAEVYQFGTEVLMGTARLQKENEEQDSERRLRQAREAHRRDLERRLAEARAEFERLTQELAGASEDDLEAERSASDQRQGIRDRRAFMRRGAPGPAAPARGEDAS